MKIKFHATPGTEIPSDMWDEEYWTHVPRTGDILQYLYHTYEVTTILWEDPREISMWIRPC